MRAAALEAAPSVALPHACARSTSLNAGPRFDGCSAGKQRQRDANPWSIIDGALPYRAAPSGPELECRLPTSSNPAFALPDIRLRLDCTRSSTMSICSWPAETLSDSSAQRPRRLGRRAIRWSWRRWHAQGAVLPHRSAIATITSLAVFERLRSPLTFREQTRRKLIE